VAEASSVTSDAAVWGPLHQELLARLQQQRQQPPQAQQQQQEQQAQRGSASMASAARDGGSHQAAAAAAELPATAGNSVAGLAAAAAAPGARSRASPRVAAVSHPMRPPRPPPAGLEARFFTFGAVAAVALHYLVNFAGTLPVVRGLVQRFVWWHEPKGPSLPPPHGDDGGERRRRGGGGGAGALAVQYTEDEESVEWVNMCWRKVCGAGPERPWPTYPSHPSAAPSHWPGAAVASRLPNTARPFALHCTRGAELAAMLCPAVPPASSLLHPRAHGCPPPRRRGACTSAASSAGWPTCCSRCSTRWWSRRWCPPLCRWVLSRLFVRKFIADGGEGGLGRKAGAGEGGGSVFAG
jgi:hypothetical protein